MKLWLDVEFYDEGAIKVDSSFVSIFMITLFLFLLAHSFISNRVAYVLNILFWGFPSFISLKYLSPCKKRFLPKYVVSSLRPMISLDLSFISIFIMAICYIYLKAIILVSRSLTTTSLVLPLRFEIYTWPIFLSSQSFPSLRSFPLYP